MDGNLPLTAALSVCKMDQGEQVGSLVKQVNKPKSPNPLPVW